MKIQNRPYLNSWIALLALSITSLLVMIISHIEFASRGIMILLLSLLWAVILASGIYLFLKATAADASRQDKPGEGKAETRPRTARKKPVEDTGQLDIDSAARKLVRSVSSGALAEDWGKAFLEALANELEIMSGLVYEEGEDTTYRPVATYALPAAREPYQFVAGEGLTGQAVKNNQVTVYRTLPEEYYEVFSGLGSTRPSYLALMPLKIKKKVPYIIEFTGFRYAEAQLEQLLSIVARDLSEALNKPKEKRST
jgi:hypothetical protein